MRQAGRSLPEYRALRAKHEMLEMCRTPELAAEATLQPVRRLGVDAAILFSDIVIPIQAVGIELDIQPKVGPVIEDPIRSERDVQRLRALEPEEDVPFVLAAIRMLRRELNVPLIGFAGAPFTLASYLIEGGPSKTHARTKAMMLSETNVWNALMERLSDIVIAYMRAQVEAGAQALQLFDSWAGQLSPDDYGRHVAPWVERIFDRLDDLDVPRIHFGVGTGELLPQMKAVGADVVGVDWRVPLDDARRRIGGDPVVQGNLDPTVCLAPFEVVRQKADEVLKRGGGRKHIFNLGHGVLPETDPDTLKRLVGHVHGWKLGD
jgi:uroporphyrinogen decarboxylase